MKTGTVVKITGVIFSLSLVLLLAKPVFAREKTDVILMKNGDRISCEVKSLDSGVLTVGVDYIDGNISVQWAKVGRLESSQPFILQTLDGTVYSGKLSTTQASGNEPVKIQITGAGKPTVAIDTSQVRILAETSDKLWQRFNGDVSFGLNYSKANQTTQYSLGADTQYTGERWAAGSTFNSNLSSNSGSTVSTRNQLGFSGYRLMRWNNYFYGGQGQFLQSSVQGIGLQTTMGGGIGRFLTNTSSSSFAVLGGFAWQNTQYSQSKVSATTQNATTALIATQLKLFKFKKTNLTVTADVLPILSEPGRVRFNTNASYYLKFFSNLSWNFSFYGDWDSHPPQGFSGSNYGTTAGLKWTYGNK